MITCGGGFSSSSIASNLNKQVIENGLADRARFLYKPFDFEGIGDNVGEVDVIFLCPHLQFQSRQLAKEFPDKPFYMIPTRMYGIVNAEDYIEDAEDVIAAFRETGKNPFCFEGEESAIKVARTVSHRKWLAKQNKNR